MKNKIRVKIPEWGKDSEKATCIIQDHWDKSRICDLLESKPLNPRNTSEFL